MRIELRSTFLTAVPLAMASLLLAACGPDRGESESPNTEDDHATQATAPTDPRPTTPAVPTNAPVEEYCAAFNGDEATLAGVETTGEAADAYENLLENQREVGTPSNMPPKTHQAFIDYVNTGADFVADLRKLPEDSPISAMRTDKEFYGEWGAKLETPEALRDYSAKNC